MSFYSRRYDTFWYIVALERHYSIWMGSAPDRNCNTAQKPLWSCFAKFICIAPFKKRHTPHNCDEWCQIDVGHNNRKHLKITILVQAQGGSSFPTLRDSPTNRCLYVSHKPQTYFSISRIWNEDPTPRLDQIKEHVSKIVNQGLGQGVVCPTTAWWPRAKRVKHNPITLPYGVRYDYKPYGRSDLKNMDHVQVQGAGRRISAAYMRVCEYFEEARYAVIGR